MDIATGWNSTYTMLESVLSLKEVFDRWEYLDPFYNDKPTGREWFVAEKVFDCLINFHEATKTFSGTKYPTSNLFFTEVCNIYLKLKEWETSDDDIVKMMCAPMKEKFDKYWDDCNLALAVAVVFDPRFKMHAVKFFYELIYKDDEDLASYHIQKVANAVNGLFIYYGGQTHTSDGPQENMPATKNRALIGFDSWYGASLGYVAKKSELEEYLGEAKHPTGDENFNVLNWWKQNSARLPNLSKAALDILATPTTTVASEATFSVGGRVLDPYRSRLKPDIVEALVVANDLFQTVPPQYSNDGECSEAYSEYATESDEE